MNDDDVNAELGNAAAVKAATALPFVGLTLAGDGTWSARFWLKPQPRTYTRNCCTHFRIVGERLTLSFNEALVPKPHFKESLSRAVSAWGAGSQADLVRIRIGVISAESIGSIVAEALARIGIRHITLLDFDTLHMVISTEPCTQPSTTPLLIIQRSSVSLAVSDRTRPPNTSLST